MGLGQGWVCNEQRGGTAEAAKWLKSKKKRDCKTPLEFP